MEGERGRIFDISRGCVDDGPGLRTVVFMKGCPMDCLWCQNPEGKSFGPEIAFDQCRCIGCGTCEAVCPRNWSGKQWRKGCTGCGACAEDCPAEARRLSGRAYNVNELVNEVSRDGEFLTGTGGGVTFSGGEPMARPNFLFACARKLRESGFHVAVETSGYFPAGLSGKLMREVDLVLFDLKQVDLERCRSGLGTGSPAALENLEKLLANKGAVEVRVTLVPGFNDSEPEVASMADWLADRGPDVTVRVQPFHRLARSKESLFDRTYPYRHRQPFKGEGVDRAAELFRKAGLTAYAG